MGKFAYALGCLILFYNSLAFSCEKELLKETCNSVWVENEFIPDRVSDELNLSGCVDDIFGNGDIVTAEKMNNFCDENNLRNKYGELKFNYKGNTLYWGYGGKKENHWLKFQLNNLIPPVISEENIEDIQVGVRSVLVNTKSYVFEVNNTNMPESEWYVVRLK